MKEDSLILIDWVEHWHLIALLILIVVGIVIVDYKKKSYERRYFRWGSYLLLLIAIAGLIIPVSYRIEVPKENAILLTDGYSPAILDSLMATRRDPKVYTLLSDTFQRSTNTTPLDGVHELVEKIPTIDTIDLLGEGLVTNELVQLSDYRVNYYPAAIPNGVTGVTFDHTTYVDNTLLISGKIKREAPVKMVIQHEDIRIDSIESDGDFSLSVTPKVTGRILYTLAEYRDDSLLASYLIPIEVIPKKKMQILFISEFPTFDTKYLKKHLISSGHKVVLRSRYSNDKYSNEYHNTDRQASVDLTSQGIGDYDLLMIDYQSLVQLNKAEERNLEAMVRSKGLSVVLQGAGAKDDVSKVKLLAGMTVVTDETSEYTITKNLSITNSGIEVASPAIPVLSVYSDRSLGGYQYSGLGKVAILSFQNSYELVLDGHEELYEAIWTDILKSIKKRTEEPIRMAIEERFPVAGSPLKVRLEDNSGVVHQLLFDEVEVPMKQNYHLPHLWSGKYWAAISGWHRLSVADSIDAYRYIFAYDDWKALRIGEKVSCNRMHFSRWQAEKNAATVGRYGYRRLSLYYFYVIFLASVAYLWIEDKL